MTSLFPRPERLRRRRGASTTVLAAAMAGSATLVVTAPPAATDPAPEPAALTVSTPGDYSGTVPDGACAVRSTVVGAAGGHNMSGLGVSAVDANGGGASITTVYTVAPGMTYAGTVGGGGEQGSVLGEGAGAGGSNGGGPGGSVVGDTHPGAGGGGWSDLRIGGTVVVLAGGGGGSAGGHSLNEGFGGNAGIPVAAGVTPGTNGLDGRQKSGDTVGGGRGGGVDAPGAGGVNSGDAALDGTAGNGSTGGAGGADRTPDAGGGGGGGYFGGGGGASTISAHGGGPPVVDGVAGAGGGGGSSFVAATSPDGSSSPVDLVDATVGERLQTAGDGADGSVTLEWVPCDYDLEVSKSVTPSTARAGETVTWTVTVTNNGPAPMTRGDTVTLADSSSGASLRTIRSIVATGGSNPVLGRDPVSCDVAAGDPMPTTMECSRPYAAPGAPGSPGGGVRGLDDGERITIVYTEVAGQPGTSVTNTATVTDRAEGDDDSATATVDVVAAPPTARPDASSGPQDAAQSVDPLVNDSPADPDTPLDPASLTLLDAGGDPADSVTVPGQGTYTVDDGRIVFTPVPDFAGTADPVTYRIADTAGTTTTSTYTPTVLAAPLEEVGQVVERAPVGSTVVLDPAEEVPGLLPGSVRLLGPDDEPVTELVVPGQGTSTVDPVTGLVTFVPESGFTGDPDPVQFTGVTEDGTPVVGELVVDYYQVSGPAGASGSTPAAGGGGAPLAQTGGAPSLLAAGGGLAVLAGTALLLAGRRRKG